MPVRKTEQRIPQIPGFNTIDGLGQHSASPTDAQIRIVSFLTSPLAVNIRQDYVVFVENPAVQPNVAIYDWNFAMGAVNTPVITVNGTATFTPPTTGALKVTVALKNSANATLHTIELNQQVNARNLELEQLIDQENAKGPSVGNPEISRIIINGLRIYADAAADPSTDAALNRLLLSIASVSLSTKTAVARNDLLENCAAAFEADPNTFFKTAVDGIGVLKFRPHLAAMYIPTPAAPLVAVTEIPSKANKATQNTTITTIETAFNGKTPEERIDVFNLLRFPKSSFKIAKLVLDQLKSKYFTETMPLVMGSRAKARRLISEYEKGPYALPAAEPELTKTSDTIFNHTILPVWKIKVSAAVNPAGTIDPQTQIFSSPEPIPEKTYIAGTGIFPGDATFINSAIKYHNQFGITFKTVISLEEIIEDLQGNATPIDHLRIFTHANKDILTMSVFKNGGNTVESKLIDGFQTSELKGAIGFCQLYFGDEHILSSDLVDEFLTALRNAGSPALVPFHLENAGAAVPPAVKELIRWFIDIWLINIDGTLVPTKKNGTTRNLTANERNTAFIPFVDMIVRFLTPDVKAAVAGLTDPQIAALRTAVIAVTRADVGFDADLPSRQPITDDVHPDDLFPELVNDLKSIVRALAPANAFMTKLAHVRNRFNASSFIDIRGCLAGKSPVFLVSLQKFFGRPGALPRVEAPDWFQSFDAKFGNESLVDKASIDALFNAGYNKDGFKFTDIEVSDNFDTWSRESKVDDQFAFFKTLFTAPVDLVSLASLRWRIWDSVKGIPPLTLVSSRVDDLGQLSFTDLLNRLRENFSATGSNITGPVATKLNALQPKIADLKRIEDQLATFAGADFSQFFTDLGALAPAISTNIPNMPAPGTPLVDAVKPNPLNKSHIEGYITNFNDYLKPVLTTDIGTIVTNIDTAVNTLFAKRVYYFKIRLPLRVENLPLNKIKVNYVVFHLDGFAAEATKTYMKCQWTGTAAQIGDMHAFIDAISGINNTTAKNFLVTGILTKNELDSDPYGAAPFPDFRAHIKHTP